MEGAVQKRRIAIDITKHLRQTIDPNKSPDEPGGNKINEDGTKPEETGRPEQPS